jgi:hypothetical protein
MGHESLNSNNGCAASSDCYTHAIPRLLTKVNVNWCSQNGYLRLRSIQPLRLILRQIDTLRSPSHNCMRPRLPRLIVGADMRYMSANLFLSPGFNAKKRATEFAKRALTLNPDVIGLQEVHTYGLLKRLMRILGPRLYRAKYQPGMLGPAGGLVIISKLPSSGVTYISLKRASNTLGRRELWRNRALGAAHKGILVAQTGGVTFVNYHGSPNHFETWKPGYGAESVQRVQMGLLTAIDRSLRNVERLCVCGDTNVDKSCALYDSLMVTGLHDPFDTEPTCSGRTRDFCCDWMLFGGNGYRPIITNATLLFVSERQFAWDIWTTAIGDHSPLCSDVEWEATDLLKATS